MSCRTLVLVAAVCSHLLADEALCQYIFLDVNGDSAHTSVDRLALGSSTIDIWLDLEKNRDGSAAQCTDFGTVTNSPLNIYGFDVRLVASGGVISWGIPTSGVFGNTSFSIGSATLYLNAYRQTPLPAGKYKLASVSVQVQSGPPSLEFEPYSTQFTTSCNSAWYIPLEYPDPYYPGWQDADGLLPLVEPILVGPTKVTGDSLIQFDLRPIASVGDSVTAIWMTSNIPSGQDVSLTQNGASARFRWIIVPQVGSTHQVVFRIETLRGRNATLTTTIAIAEDRPPIVVAPESHDRRVGANVVTVSATDPDGDTILSLTRTLSNGRVTSFSVSQNTESGVVSWSSNSMDTLNYSIEFTAANALAGSATTIVVGDKPPVINAPTTLQVVRESTLQASITASDPNGDPVPVFTADLGALPPGHNATFSAGVLTWRPTITTVGSFQINFRAANRLQALASTQVHVVTIPPVPAFEVRPARGSGRVEVLIDATSSVDPDGEISEYIFEFGAKTVGPQSQPYVSHTFEGEGVHTFAVTAIDNEAARSTRTGSIRVHPPQSYMFLDVNRDSVHSPDDRLGQLGVPTSTTIWLRTDRSRIGEPAECSMGLGSLTVNSYEFILKAIGGRVSWGSFVNVQPGMNVSFEEASSDSEYHNGFGGLEALPPGLHRLGTLEITPLEGNPRIDIMEASSLAGVYTTSFGSRCEGLDFDNTLKLGSDWADADGLRAFQGVASPLVQAPWSVQAQEGVTCSILVVVMDPDMDPIESVTLEDGGVPADGNISIEFDAVSRSALFCWTPGFSDSRSEPYSLVFRAQSGVPSSSGTATTLVTVQNLNRGPTAGAGGRYFGTVGQSVLFNGSTSSDPDGDAISAYWEFGDGTAAPGWTPQHLYSDIGSYVVILTVSDGTSASSDTTEAVISEGITAKVFSAGADSILNLVGGRGSWCLNLEEVPGTFRLADVDPARVSLWSDRSGSSSIDSIGVRSGSVVAGGDVDGNEVPEMFLCFRKEDLRNLLGHLWGSQTVGISLKGVLQDGRVFVGSMQQLVLGMEGGTDAQVSPNPLNPRGTLTFRADEPGIHVVRIFDVSGRLVRTIQGAVSHPGYTAIPVEGSDDAGRPLGSGVYFFQIASPKGKIEGRFTVLR